MSDTKTNKKRCGSCKIHKLPSCYGTLKNGQPYKTCNVCISRQRRKNPPKGFYLSYKMFETLSDEIKDGLIEKFGNVFIKTPL
jgi:hypothetical protein